MNLILRDAESSNHNIANCFEMVQMVFGHNILRWQELQSTFDTKTLTKTTFETLKPTQWAGGYNSIYARKTKGFRHNVMCESHIERME